jgi:signal peptidase I
MSNKPIDPETKKTVKSIAKEWGESIVVAALLAMFVRIFFFEPYKIPTSSMVPTLLPGDKIFVTKMVYGPRIPLIALRLPGTKKAPVRGEVVVFIAPEERQKAYIKRVIGLPGDKVEIKLGNIYINGQQIKDPKISKNFYYNAGEYGAEGKEVTVPSESYFVLGDNSASSRDSRYWGFVQHKDVLGKALFIWWPPKRVRNIN